jgi:transposase
MALKITNQLIHLPSEVTINSMETHEHSFELFLSFPPPQERICPDCGSTHCVVKDSGRMQTVRHIALSGSGTMLTFRRRRYRCKDCGRSFYEPIYWLHPSLHMTYQLYLDICQGLTTTHSLCSIARQNCVTEAIVQSVIDSVDFDRPQSLPKTLCIDEFKGSSGTYDSKQKRWIVDKFHCNISDGDAGCIIDILPAITLDELLPYFFSFDLSLRQEVRFFACDMHGGFITLAKRCFPNVTVCIDMFHVVRLINTNIDTIRIELQKELRTNGDEDSYQLLKHSSRLLKTACSNQLLLWGDNLSKNQQRLRSVLLLSNDLQEAYDALQEFHFILQMTSYGLQRATLTTWLNTYTSSECPSTRTMANTIRHHRQYIQNSWRYGKSNGPCEGLNKKIKDIKRNASGAHSFINFRKRILFACGYTKFVQESYTIFAEKRVSRTSKRKR